MRKLLLALGFVGALTACTKTVTEEVIVEKIVEVVDTAEIERLQGVINGLNETLAELQAEYTYVNESQSAFIHELNAQIEDLQAELAEALDNSADEALINELNAELLRLEQALVEAEAEVIIEYVEVEVETIVETIVEVERTVTVDNTDYDTINELEATIATLQNTVTALQADLVNFENLQGLVGQLQAQLDTANAQLDTLQANLENANTQVELLQNQLDNTIEITGATAVETPAGRGGNWFAVDGGFIQRYVRDGVTYYQAWFSIDPLTPAGGRETTPADALGNL